MITEETVKQYIDRLEDEWSELNEQFYDAIERGFLPDVETIRAAQLKNRDKFEAILELRKIETEKLKKVS